MFTLSDKFHEQFPSVQKQFHEWTQCEELYAMIELTRTLKPSYRHFFSELFQVNIQHENTDMFNLTVDHANTPDIINCLLKDSLDKVLITLQLYLPLVSTKSINDQLLDAYRDVFIYLDTNLIHPTKLRYTEQELIHFCQQICFFIQINPNLQKLLSHIPQLINIVKTKKFNTDEQQQHHHQPLQRYPSIRTSTHLSNFASEGSQNSLICQQLTRHETNDSGVDLTEPVLPNAIQQFLSAHNERYPFAVRAHSPNLSSSHGQNKHSFVAKTASSPIPEHATFNRPAHVPLTAVLSAPVSSRYSNYQQQKHHQSLLPKSDEDEQESQPQLSNNNTHTTHSLMDDYILDNHNNNNNATDTARLLGQFYSFRYRNPRNNQNTGDVSQYLGVDANSAPVRNTFTQANTGMRDVPKWLKHLRLHKYDVFFSQMTYDQMMNLTMEQLKELLITDGACTKILLHIKKLKERSAVFKQCLIDIDNGQIDLQSIVTQLQDLMLTPIRAKQADQEIDDDEDLPKLIMQILEKVYQQITPNSSSDICNNLLGLFDRCYRHEAFTVDQRYIILQWRRPLSTMLQKLGKTDYKTIQSVSNHPPPPRRGSMKPPIKTFKSSSAAHCPNYSSSSISLGKYNSEPQNNNSMESNIIRRPTKSPTLVYPTTEESNDTNNYHSSFNCMTSTPQRNHGDYLANNQHQALTRKASIDPYGETNNNNDKNKLCKTFSDPNRIRFGNSTHNNNNMQLSSTRSQQQQQQQSLFRMISTPYSQQQRQFISRSPPLLTIDSSSPIKKCYSDNERSAYYGNNDKSISSSNDNENPDEQRHHNREFESFCRQITESAISEDVNNSSIDPNEEILDVFNVKQSSNNSTDNEQ